LRRSSGSTRSPFSASGGLAYQGLIPGRDDDLTALAVYYGDRLEDQNAETWLSSTTAFS
jgi:hypothetical protein